MAKEDPAGGEPGYKARAGTGWTGPKSEAAPPPGIPVSQLYILSSNFSDRRAMGLG